MDVSVFGKQYKQKQLDIFGMYITPSIEGCNKICIKGKRTPLVFGVRSRSATLILLVVVRIR
jgi:hypothetical protein